MDISKLSDEALKAERVLITSAMNEAYRKYEALRAQLTAIQREGEKRNQTPVSPPVPRPEKAWRPEPAANKPRPTAPAFSGDDK